LDAAARNPRNHLLIQFLWWTGARISEAINVKVDNIDFFANIVSIRTLKQKKKEISREIPLKRVLREDLSDYIEKAGLLLEDRLFPFTRFYANELIINLCRKAGLDRKRAHPHTLRHSFAVNQLLRGVPVLLLAQWMGHADVNNTLIYTKILSQDGQKFMN
jgi:integrase